MGVREILAVAVCEGTQKTNYKCEFNCEKKGKCAYCLVMAEQMIAHGVTVQEWISVKDRLPKSGERVLVSVGAVFEAFVDDDGKWQRYYLAPLNEVLGQPTHWMPLPPPPKGE